jgi:hypothetical protein
LRTLEGKNNYNYLKKLILFKNESNFNGARNQMEKMMNELVNDFSKKFSLTELDDISSNGAALDFLISVKTKNIFYLKFKKMIIIKKKKM